ncbi:MAG: YqgE/AlgH family protein, partial [Sediminibacterium sp.]|nr:YqgE/AlgH family protein [Sediminibacterium sp.]
MEATPFPIPGSLLISDPFLQDPNFSRSVVLICEHESTGSFGLVLNQPMHL